MNRLAITATEQWKTLIHAIKRKHNTFTFSQLKKYKDMNEWNMSIFK